MPDVVIVTFQWVSTAPGVGADGIDRDAERLRDAWEWALEEEMCRLGVEAA